MFNYICVYKTGGDYSPQYVKAFVRGVRRFLPPGRIVCLTDDVEAVRELNLEIGIRRLAHDWPGWWSKLEIFSHGISTLPHEQTLFLDLDTQIVKPLPDLELAKGFYMLKGFRGRPASGIMAWRGADVHAIYEFTLEILYRNQNSKVTDLAKNDQDWILKMSRYANMRPKFIQEVIPKIYSFKHHCRPNGPPEDCQIVCFHGKPRPLQATNHNWVGEYFND